MENPIHHFTVKADPKSGMWDKSSIHYTGLIDFDEHLAKQDTDAEHYDTHSVATFNEGALEAAGLSDLPANQDVAITVIWAD